MLNFKKGLALILAAATAFTFAPVANLGANVTAQAAVDASKSKNRWLTLENGQYLVHPNQNSNAKLKISAQKTPSSKWDPANKIISGSVSGMIGEVKDAEDQYTFNFTKDKDAYLNIQQVAGSNKANSVLFDIANSEELPNGAYSFTLTRISSQTGDPIDSDPKTVTLTITDSTTYSIAVNAGETLTEHYNASGVNDYYELNYSSTGSVTFTSKEGEGERAKNKDAYWTFTSDTPSVVTVSPNEDEDKAAVEVQLTGVAAGNAKITAKAFESKEHKTLLAEKTISIAVNAVAEGNITSVKATYGSKTNETVANGGAISLDTLVTRTAALSVEANGSVTYKSSDPSVASVSETTGEITALKVGVATITITAAANNNYAEDTWKINVVVSSSSKDYITADYDDKDKVLNLDLSTSTASNAVKSADLNAKSAVGTALKYDIVSNNDKKDVLGNTAVATVDATGKVTAGATDGIVFVKVSPATKNANSKITDADPIYVKVVVNKLPEADIPAADLEDIYLDHDANKTVTLDNNADYSYSLDTDASAIVRLNKNELTARDDKYGKGVVTLSVKATAATRLTTKPINVYVVPQVPKKDTTKAPSDLAITSDSKVTLNVGETSTIAAKATSQSAITFSSSDEAVATVSSEGAIEAKAAGSVVITVKAAATETIAEGTQFVYVTVKAAPVEVKAPKKVTGVKFYYKKGVVAKVTWTKRPTAAGYQIKYTVNGKTTKTTRVGNKAAIVIKSGKKVTVQVRAFKLNENGERVYGKWSAKASRTKSL